MNTDNDIIYSAMKSKIEQGIELGCFEQFFATALAVVAAISFVLIVLSIDSMHASLHHPSLHWWNEIPALCETCQNAQRDRDK